MTFDNDSPLLWVTSPLSGAVKIPEDGTQVQLEAWTNNYGQRRVRWAIDNSSGLAVQDSTEPTKWTATVPVAGTPFLPRTLSVTVDYPSLPGLETVQMVTLQPVDCTPPRIWVVSPKQEQTYVLGTAGITVTIRGKASDSQSGVAVVEYRLRQDEGYRSATPADTWDTWTVSLAITDIGYYHVYLRAVDVTGNISTPDCELLFQVVGAAAPASLADRLSPRAYLEALSEFAHDRVIESGTGGSGLSELSIEQLFNQPLRELIRPENADIGNQPINELRGVAEILRRFLPTATAAPIPATGSWTFDADTLETRADGTRVAHDSSGHGHDADIVGVTSVPAPRGGAALHFDARGYAEIPSHPDWDLLSSAQGDFTISLFIQPEWHAHGITDRQVIFSNGLHGLGLWLDPIWRRVGARCPAREQPRTPLWFVASGGSLPPGSGHWSHLALVRDADNLLLYVDGSLAGEGKSIACGSPGTPLYVGGMPVSPATGVFAAIAELRIYAAALPEDAIRSLAQGSDNGQTSAQATPAAAAEALYRDAAYDGLLAALGTSYEELRLARGAAPEARQTLAGRLGIKLTAVSPDELEQLTITSPARTEKGLELLFGLRDSHVADTLPAPAPDPLLLTWQGAALRAAWQDEDHGANPVPRTFRVILDPDLVGIGDLMAQSLGRALLTARLTEVQGICDRIAELIASNNTEEARFAAAVAATFPSGADLAGLDKQEQDGKDIEPALAGLGLNLDAFHYLRRMSQLASGGTLDDDEWGQVIAILTQVEKARRYSDWRQEESAIVLSPDNFVMSGQAPPASSWRADPRMRREWQDVLQARSLQLQELGPSLAAMVADVEQQALPVLRDALVAAVPAGKIAGDVTEWLTDRLQIDVKASGALPKTRILQATETVQSLLFSIRSGRFEQSHPAYGWDISGEVDFDAEWPWIGTFDGWRSAMAVYLYPENHLDPGLLKCDPTPTQGFRDLIQNLRAMQRINRDDASNCAQSYLDAVRSALPTLLNSFAYPDRPTAINLEDLWATGRNALAAYVAPAPPPYFQEAGEQDPTCLREVFFFVPLALAMQLQASGEYLAALDWFQLIYAYNRPADKRAIYYGLQLERSTPADLSLKAGWLQHLNPHQIAAARPNPYTRFTLLEIARCLADYGDALFTRDTLDSVAEARGLYTTARSVLSSPALQPPQAVTTSDSAPQTVEFTNPVVDALSTRVETQLVKLRQGWDIAGLQRTVDLPDPNAPVSFTPPPPAKPTSYRYKTLLDRSRQLVALAQQLEAEYLSALEKYDDRAYRRFEADKALDLTQVGVVLQGLKVGQAEDGVTLAQAQKNRADFQVDQYQQLITSGLTQHERAMLSDYGNIRDINNIIGGFDLMIGTAQTAMQASSASTPWGLVIGGATGTVITGGMIGKYAESRILGDAQNQLQSDTLFASQERRVQEWQLQQGVARQDSAIAAQQIVSAQDQLAIAHQEAAVAQLQHDQAQLTVRYLDQQFTNAELYQWMSGVLGGSYRYFLQQATATARMAQDQLAFERQEPPLQIIQPDYWAPPDATSGTSSPDRRGLTGAERLLEDISQVDQLGFQTDRRRLNLTQTLSLAQRAPLDFQVFRSTGVLQFATPMDWFDDEFPGHYLRMIKRVRTSVVGLIPPTQGIRATLAASGISRVVVGGNTFDEVVMRRDPESIALTSPVGASGVFDLDPQPDMLLPFEDMGVATTWELRLPKPANPFDFTSIVDVLISIDYTALDSDDYRQQLLQQRNRNTQRAGDRAFSLRRDFPDQWYALHNPSQATGARTVTLTLDGTDFPTGLDRLQVAQLVVYLAPAGDPIPPTAVTLQHAGQQGTAQSDNGLISTRRRNALEWDKLRGESSPTGDWQLTMDTSAGPALDHGQLADIVLVIGYTGDAPPWPS